MKKFILTCVAAMAALVGAMAVPAFQPVSDGIMYQAVLRNDAGAVVASTEVDVTIELRNIMNVVAYSETHTATTDEFGLLTLKIGGGENTSQYLFEDIDWSYRYKVKIGVDVDGNGSADITCSEWLMDVPYAYYAKKSKDFQTSAAAKLTEDELNVIKAMAITPVTVSMANLNKAPGGWVEINGQRIDAENPTVELNVPAYSPVYVSWNKDAGQGVSGIKLNGKDVNIYSGSYYVADKRSATDECYMIFPASDWAKVSTRESDGKGDYKYKMKSDNEIYAYKGTTGVQKLSPNEYYKLYSDADLHYVGGEMYFTHPADTRFTAANSYIHVYIIASYMEDYNKEVKIEKTEFKKGENFLVGPFDPTKKNTIEVIYKNIVY